MDSLKKRKLDENGSLLPDHDPTFLNNLTIEESRTLLQPLTHEQLFEIIQDAVARHPDVLEAVRSIVDRDTTQRKLFIRGLGWETTTEKLRALFSQYGDLDEAVVILDKATGKSKGYGFITFKHIDGALRALRQPSKQIDGRMTVTQLAAAGMSGGGGPGALVGNGNNTSNLVADVSTRKIYVANVPSEMPGERLLQHFSMYGEIEEGPLGFDKATGKSKGFALFVYKTAEAARASLVDPVKNVDGHQLNCKLAIDGKKGKPNVGGPGAVQGGSNGQGDGFRYGVPGGMGGPYGGSGGVVNYSGYSGANPLNSAPGSGAVSVASQGSSLVGGGGFGSGPYGGGSHFSASGYGGPSGGGALSAGGANGLGSTVGGLTAGSLGGPSSGVLGGSGIVLGGPGGALSGVGSGFGTGRGSSLYGLGPNSIGMPSGEYPQSAPYSLSSSSAYQNQPHQSTGISPAPRVPPGGSYQGIPPYY